MEKIEMSKINMVHPLPELCGARWILTPAERRTKNERERAPLISTRSIPGVIREDGRKREGEKGMMADWVG